MTEVDYCRWDSSCGRKVKFSRAAHAHRRFWRIHHSGYGFCGRHSGCLSLPFLFWLPHWAS
jgi:hypothetical protein